MPRNSPLVGLLASCLTIRIGLNHTNHLPSYSLLVFEGKKEGRRGREGKGREGKGREGKGREGKGREGKGKGRTDGRKDRRKEGRKEGRKRKEREGRKERDQPQTRIK